MYVCLSFCGPEITRQLPHASTSYIDSSESEASAVLLRHRGCACEHVVRGREAEKETSGFPCVYLIYDMMIPGYTV